jgi:NADH:ubiquinone oxidoreductase subunit 2 (subunit N)
LLLGFSILYFSFGFFTIDSIFSLSSVNSYFLFSYLFISLSIILKLGLYPFHQWVCDVYEGCLTTVTLFFSTIPKLVIFSLFVRFTYFLFLDFSYFSYIILFFFSFLSSSFFRLHSSFSFIMLFFFHLPYFLFPLPLSSVVFLVCLISYCF